MNERLHDYGPSGHLATCAVCQWIARELRLDAVLEWALRVIAALKGER